MTGLGVRVKVDVLIHSSVAFLGKLLTLNSDAASLWNSLQRGVNCDASVRTYSDRTLPRLESQLLD